MEGGKLEDIGKFGFFDKFRLFVEINKTVYYY